MWSKDVVIKTKSFYSELVKLLYTSLKFDKLE